MMDRDGSPKSILDEIKQEQSQQSSRGRLKIFLGYAAGIGKTYAMLQAAKLLESNGHEVVIGYLEPHDRPETLAQAEGLEQIAPLSLIHRGLTLRELDLDACQRRSPEIILIDELAHTNAPGLRHAKRWQDVLELLAQGIDVYSTLNVQHIDSLNDIVEKVTGVAVKETIPDAVFDQADEVELVDLPPEELIARLQAGKIYAPDQAQRAEAHFFQKSNLLALREIALRRTASRVGQEVDRVRSAANAEKIWPVRERLLVSVSPSPTSADLLRSAARLAQALQASLLAVYIETPQHRVMGERSQTQLQKNLQTAASLGAEIIILQGEAVAQDLLAFARSRNVTKIVLGKNRDPAWKRLFRRTIGDQILQQSGDIDIFVIQGQKNHLKPTPELRLQPLKIKSYLGALLLTALAGLLAVTLGHLGLSSVNSLLTLLMAVVSSAFLFGRMASVVASLLSITIYNFFFTQPLYSFAVDSPQDYLGFGFFLVVGLLTASLAGRLQSQTLKSREREHRIEQLHRLSRQLVQTHNLKDLGQVAETTIAELAGMPVAVLSHRNQSDFYRLSGLDLPPFTPNQLAVLNWVDQNRKPAGRGTGTLDSSTLIAFPMPSNDQNLGILLFLPNTDFQPTKEMIPLWESFAANVGLVLEREFLGAESQKIASQMEQEKTRNLLLQSISHDLKTPLTVITGSATALLENSPTEFNPSDRKLLSEILQESQWLNRQVDSLLTMAKFDGGEPHLKPVWTPPEEIVYACFQRLKKAYPLVPLNLIQVPDTGLALIDPFFVEQALFNVVENAIVYAPHPDGVQVEIDATDQSLTYRILDRGPGIPDGEKKWIFYKFYRGKNSRNQRRNGTGLGLAIVKAICQAHHGSCLATNRPGGGTILSLTLCWDSRQPDLPGGEVP